ncbi:MAG: hypothetical protein ABIR57_03870 [Aeromicrobium sp.]
MRVGHGGSAGGPRRAAVEVEGREDGGVEDFAGFRTAGVVELLSMAQQLDDLLKPFKDGVAGGLGTLDEPLGVSDLDCEPGLAFFERTNWESIGHVGVDEFLLVAFQFGQASLLVDNESASRFSGTVEFVTGPLAELGDLVVGEADGCPLALYFVFGVFDGHIGQVAGGAAGVASEAEEVVVFAAAAFGSSVAHAAGTASTPQGAFEVVGVSP